MQGKNAFEFLVQSIIAHRQGLCCPFLMIGQGFSEQRIDGFASLVVKETPGPCAADYLLVAT